MGREAGIGKWAVVFLLFLVVGMVSSTANSQVVSIAPADTCVAVGDTFEVRITADANILNLMAYSIKASFDSTVLSVVDVVEGSLLTSGGPTFWNWEMVGSDTVWIENAILTGGPYVDGPGTLAVISFEATGTGESPVVLARTKLWHGYQDPIPHTTADGTVCVTAIGPGVDVVSGPGMVGTEGEDVPVAFNILNRGNIADIYDVTVTDDQGWTLNPSTFSVSLAPCCTDTTVSIMASIPSGALAGTVDMIELKAISQADPSVKDSSSVGVTVIDTISPAPINDLSTSTTTSSSITLTWTSPGDDGTVGTASLYDIRYSHVSVGTDTSGWWNTADTVIGEPSPSSPGTTDSCQATGLSSETTYYFLIKTADEVLNWSGFSNVAYETTAVGVEGIDGPSELPRVFKLFQNYPNPFNPTTEISYVLPHDSYVRVEIYNLLGQRVITLVDEYQKAGYKRVEWDGRDENRVEMGSGVYFCRLKAGHHRSTKRMVLLR